jgi:hypothetical protein
MNDLVVKISDPIMDDIKIKFDGATHQIEANTLINSLLHFSNIVQEVNRELKTERKIEVKVNALSEGSFLVHIILESNLLEAVENLFTKNNIEIASSLMTVVGGVYTAAKFLKGKKGKVLEAGPETTKIESQGGDVTYIDNRVYTIYENNKLVREAISQEFQTLSKDENVTGFAILNTNNEPIVSINKEEFNEIGGMQENTLMLNIVRLSFEKTMKWEFYYDGNKISARINDEDFAKLIDNGEQFAKGDSLEAEIEIQQEFHKPVNAYINKSYKVIKILNHIPRPKQSTIFQEKLPNK